MDERRNDSGRLREDRPGSESSARGYGREGSWTRPEYGTTYDRDRGSIDRGPYDRSRTNLNRERDFGRTDRYANADEAAAYGARPWTENRPSGYGRGAENYRGTSGYETDRGAGSFGSRGHLNEGRPFSSFGDWESGPFVGRGPRGYRRSDEGIHEELCERLTRHGRIDASDIEVRVVNGEVTLEGSVDDRDSKRLAEDVAESISGVRDVNNQIKVYRREREPVGTAGRSRIDETARTDENTGSVLGLAGTSNTPEITPPDRGEPKKG